MEEEYEEKIRNKEETIQKLMKHIAELSEAIKAYDNSQESNKKDIGNIRESLKNINEKINQRTNNGNLDLSEEEMQQMFGQVFESLGEIKGELKAGQQQQSRNTNVRDFSNPQPQYYQQPFQQQYFQQVPVQPVQQFPITEGQLRNIVDDAFERFHRNNGYLYTLKQNNEYKEQEVNALLKKLDDTISKIPDVLSNGLKKQTNEDIETREARDLNQNLTELKNTIGNFIENLATERFRNTNVNGNELLELIKEIKKAIVISREEVNMKAVEQAAQIVASNSNLRNEEKYEQIFKIVLANEDTRNKLLSEQSERLLQMHSTDIEMLKEMFDSLRKDSAGMINYIGNLSQEYNKSTERIVNSTFSQINQVVGQMTQSFGQAIYGLGQMVTQLSNSVFALANSNNNLALENQKQTQGTKLLEPGINATSAEVTKEGDTRVKDLDEKAPKPTRSSKEEKPKKSKKKAQDETLKNIYNIARSSRIEQSNSIMRGSMAQAATMLHLANKGFIDPKRLGELYESAEGTIVAGYNSADKIEEKVTEDVTNMMINIQRNTNTRVVPAIQQGQTSTIPAIDEPVRNVQYVTYVPQATPQVIQQPIGQPVAVQNVSNASGVYYLPYSQLTTTNIPPNAAQIAQQVLPTTLSTPAAPNPVNGANVIQMPYAPIQQNQYAKQ